jgi:hypothetical protein
MTRFNAKHPASTLRHRTPRSSLSYASPQLEALPADTEMAPKSPPTEAGVSRRIVFFHPDLGIGGAERLIIDAAVGLQELGHKVTIFTSHCDPQHSFEEARDGTFSRLWLYALC